jgi:vacuolar-type H+-ATPase subunit H
VVIKLSVLNQIIQAENNAKNLINEAKGDQKIILETSKKHAEAKGNTILVEAKAEAEKIHDESIKKIEKLTKKHEEELTNIEKTVHKNSSKNIDKLVDFVVDKVTAL